MKPFFNKSIDLVMLGLTLAKVLGIVTVAGAVWVFATPEFWERGYKPVQPIAFSHLLHAGELGIDCRYCHSNVEHSHEANVPTADVCMNCHSVTDEVSGSLARAQSVDGAAPSPHWTNEELARLRETHAAGESVPWRRVHKLPDYVRFNHAAHVNAGVSCYSCHGRIDQMPIVRQQESLSMAWCLGCHRDPAGGLVDMGQVTITDLAEVEKRLESKGYAAGDGEDLRQRLLRAHNGQEPPTSCGACHY